MFSLKTANQLVMQLESIHPGDRYLIFKTPANARCNTYPLNIYNTGPYGYCLESERQYYEQRGATFLEPKHNQ